MRKYSNIQKEKGSLVFDQETRLNVWNLHEKILNESEHYNFIIEFFIDFLLI